jgi:hypothetical protein
MHSKIQSSLLSLACFLFAKSFKAFVNFPWPDCRASKSWQSAVANSKLVHQSGMTGVEVIKVRKHVGRSNTNCLVRNDEVASGNSRPYMCSDSCTPMFEMTAIFEESVMAVCLAFLPAVLEYNAITMKKLQRHVCTCKKKFRLDDKYWNKIQPPTPTVEKEWHLRALNRRCHETTTTWCMHPNTNWPYVQMVIWPIPLHSIDVWMMNMAFGHSRGQFVRMEHGLRSLQSLSMSRWWSNICKDNPGSWYWYWYWFKLRFWKSPFLGCLPHGLSFKIPLHTGIAPILFW